MLALVFCGKFLLHIPFLFVCFFVFSCVLKKIFQDILIRTRGAWWCRYRGHWRSGPRHLSPRSRVCAQEWHSEDIHSHIHSHPAMHTPQKQKTKHTSTHQTWCLRLIVLFLSNVVVGDFQQAWLLLLRTSLRRRPSRLGQYWQKTFVDVFNAYANISRQQCPF